MQQPHAQRLKHLRRLLRDILQATVQSMLLLIILLSVVGRFEIEQTSMEPNLHEGERVIVNQLGTVLPARLARTAHAASHTDAKTLGLKRGQVVVFYPTLQRSEPPLIKRLIALPGDTITIHNNTVSVNGDVLIEPYVHGKETDCQRFCEPLTLAANEYFFLGDNRPVSRDSRNFGPVPADQIVGPVVLRYWPLDAFATDL